MAAMRYFWLFLALWGFLLPLRAAEAGYGIVRGTVRFDGGAAFPRAKVTIEVGGANIGLTAGEDGTFTALVPAGTATARTTWTDTQLSITPGEVTSLNITVTPAVGVIIAATYPDGTMYTGSLTVAVRQGVGQEQRILFPLAIGAGHYWLPEVAASERELAVRAGLQGTFLHGSALQRFSFEKDEPLRRVTMTVPSSAPVVLTIVDAHGIPLANTAVTGRLSRTVPDAFNFWPESPANESYTDTDLQWLAKPCRTDDEGRLDLGKLVPQAYALTLATATADGARTPLEVKADGTCTLKTYAVRGNRATVTQTVFRPDGTPAAHAEAYASYCQAGRAVIRRATSDDDGRIIWSNLPHARVIVAGAAIAPGVIPPDGVNFLTPLPAPTALGVRKFHVEIAVSGKEPVTFGAVLRSGDQVHTRRLNARLNDRLTGSSSPETWECTAGAPFSLLWGATFTPLQVRLLDGAYLPYLDEGVEQIDLPMADLPFTDFRGVAVSGRLLTAEGTPTFVNGLQIMPAEGNPLYSLLQAGKFSWLLRPTVQPDGTFTASLPPTGAYDFRLPGAAPQVVTITDRMAPGPVEIRQRSTRQ